MSMMLIILGILIIIGFAFVVYSKKQKEQSQEKTVEETKVVKCKYDQWSSCDCNTRRITRKLLEGDSKTCKDTLRSCVPDPAICCKYSKYDECDCNTKTKTRLLISGDAEICFDTEASCEPDPDICCKYTNFGICDCNTNRKTKTLKASESPVGICQETISEACTDNEYRTYCCEYSSWQQTCDCNNNIQRRTLVRGTKPKCNESLTKTCPDNLYKENCCVYSADLQPSDWCPCDGKKKRELIGGSENKCDPFKEESCSHTQNEVWACETSSQQNLDAMTPEMRRQYIDSQIPPVLRNN